jgi:hypothetical protein
MASTAFDESNKFDAATQNSGSVAGGCFAA